MLMIQQWDESKVVTSDAGGAFVQVCPSVNFWLPRTAAADLSMSQRTSQCRSGPLGKFLIRRKVGRRIDL